MDRAEGVGHVHLGHGGHLLGQLRVVLGLALLKAGVLEKHNLAGLQRGGLGLGVGPHHIAGKDDILAQQLAQTLCHRLHAQRFQSLLPLLFGERGGILALFGLLLGPLVEAGLRLAQVGAGDHRRPLVQQVLDGGQGGADALVVGDDAAAVLGHGHVEVAAKKNLLALHVDVLDRLLVVIHGNLAPFSITI